MANRRRRAHGTSSSIGAGLRGSVVGAPSTIACLAPRTPYSYGLPTTCGIWSKLKTGGGGDLPLEGERAPRVRGRRLAGPPAHEHVVEKDASVEAAQEEAGDGDEEVPVPAIRS